MFGEKSNFFSILLYVKRTFTCPQWKQRVSSNCSKVIKPHLSGQNDYCNFNQTQLVGVDFFNSNLKKTSFKNAILENVIFFNCNLKDTNFENAQFRQVIFIATNLDVAKKLTITGECKVYRSYPSIELNHAVHQQLLALSEFERLYKYNVLHVNKNKLNLWSIQVLLDCYGENVFRAVCALKYKNDKRHLYTVHSYMCHIEKYLKL